MRALFDVLQAKLIKRGVPVKNLDDRRDQAGRRRHGAPQIKLKMALDGDTAKKVAAAIKDAKLKKVQAAIQGDQVRVTSPSRTTCRRRWRFCAARTSASSSSSGTTADSAVPRMISRLNFREALQ